MCGVAGGPGGRGGPPEVVGGGLLFLTAAGYPPALPRTAGARPPAATDLWGRPRLKTGEGAARAGRRRREGPRYIPRASLRRLKVVRRSTAAEAPPPPGPWGPAPPREERREEGGTA